MTIGCFNAFIKKLFLQKSTSFPSGAQRLTHLDRIDQLLDPRGLPSMLIGPFGADAEIQKIR